MGPNSGKSAGNLTPRSHVHASPYPDGGKSGVNGSKPNDPMLGHGQKSINGGKGVGDSKPVGFAK